MFSFQHLKIYFLPCTYISSDLQRKFLFLYIEVLSKSDLQLWKFISRKMRLANMNFYLHEIIYFTFSWLLLCLYIFLFSFFALSPDKKKNESNSTRDRTKVSKEYWTGFRMLNLQWRGWFLSNAGRDEILIDLSFLIIFKFHPM